MPYDLRELIDWIVSDFEPCVRVGDTPGAYARRREERFVHLYGAADMACVLYTLGLLPEDAASRAAWAAHLQALQDPETGYFTAQPPDHSVLHNTAFALGALNLLDAPPRWPLRFAGEVATLAQLRERLDALDWRSGVYRGSHDGAGLASALALVPGSVGEAWFAAYFDYTDAKFDPLNGMMGVGKPPRGDTDQIGGTFHYAFLYRHFKRPLPYPEARTDAILGLQLPSGNWHDANPWWLTLDAVYLLSRDQRQAAHRAADVRQCIERAVDGAWQRLGADATREAMTPHTLTAAVSLLAEAQQFLGVDAIRTDGLLRLVLDRRPFI